MQYCWALDQTVNKSLITKFIQKLKKNLSMKNLPEDVETKSIIVQRFTSNIVQKM